MFELLFEKVVVVFQAATLTNGLETPQDSDSEESSDDESNVHTTIR